MSWVLLGVVIAVIVALSVAARRIAASRDHTATIDPFGVGEPWRQFVSGAKRSGTRLHLIVDGAPEGPLKDRMISIVARFDDGLAETWQIACRGDRIDDAIRQLDPTLLRSRFETLNERRATNPSGDVDAAIESVERQIESAERLRTQSSRTADRLRLTQSRFDELVSRAAEVAIGAGDSDRYEHDVDDLVVELEALRQAVEETNRP